MEPIQPFTFLVEGKPFEVTSKVSVENFDLLMRVDFTLLQFKEQIADFNSIISEWPRMPFFTNEDLKLEYLSLCYEGQRAYNRLEHNILQILKFLNQEEDVSVNTCTYTSHKLELSELERGVMNLRNRYNQVKRDWTVESIKTDLGKRNSLVLFCNQFADYSTTWDDYTSSMLGALQELSDRIYPELIVSQFERNCTASMPGDGESFTVTTCKASKIGYRCQIEVAKATEVREYYRLWPVHYEDIHICGEHEKQIFGKDMTTGEIKLLDCTVIVSPDFPSCIVTDLEPQCKLGLSMEKVEEAVSYCNFASGKPELTTPLPHGGVFIQGDKDVQITNGENRIPMLPPIAVYSPLPITVRESEEDLVYPPSINVDKLITVESKLNAQQIAHLLSTVRWNERFENMGTSDYIRYSLVLIQLILFPTAIVSLVFMIKQRKQILRIIGRKGTSTKRNYRQNTQYLLKRVKGSSDITN